MTVKRSRQAERKPRADAQRNRARILEVAKQAFTRHGVDASLDDIAKKSGVGPGTLYRHFPTRETLLEEVYRTEVEKLAAAEAELAGTMPPVEALRAWMLLFVDYLAAKVIIAPALRAKAGAPSKALQGSGDLIRRSINALAKRAVASGDLRPDIEPIALLRALVGVSNTEAGPDWPRTAKQMVDILITGSRPAR